VRTIGDGTVDFAGVQNGYGNVIYVKHANHHETVYAHLSRIDVHKGQSVSQGQTIGAVGQTGWATGPHLHFEFRVNDKQVDPMTTALHSEAAHPLPRRSARPSTAWQRRCASSWPRPRKPSPSPRPTEAPRRTPMNTRPARWFIGLMSGTSLDGIDGVLVDLSGSNCHVAGHAAAPFTPELRASLLALNVSGPDELHRARLAANALAQG